MLPVTLPIDFNLIRKAFAREIQKVTGFDSNHVVLLEPETQNSPRPSRPYMGFKFTTPAAKSGDDSKDSVLDTHGNPTTIVNSGGVRKMTISFQCYATSHEEAYNFMSLWQTALDLSNIQEDLRRSGIAVWIIGNVADLSALLNTGYEGRSQMDCTFGIAMNLSSDLGSEDAVEVQGSISSDQNNQVINTDQKIPPF